MLNSYIAEPACSHDAELISAMMARSFGQLLAEDYDAETLHQALPHIATARPELLSSGTYFVVRDKGRNILGAGGWTDISPTRGLASMGEAHIRHVAVDPSALKKGVGRALLEESFISAQSFGMSALRCFSTLTAAPFYAAMGFEEVQQIELALAPGIYFPAVEMRRVLH